MWPRRARCWMRDHFGLEKVKERILETIAVRQMNPEGHGQILCLGGPARRGQDLHCHVGCTRH